MGVYICEEAERWRAEAKITSIRKAALFLAAEALSSNPHSVGTFACYLDLPIDFKTMYSSHMYNKMKRKSERM